MGSRWDYSRAKRTVKLAVLAIPASLPANAQIPEQLTRPPRVTLPSTGTDVPMLSNHSKVAIVEARINGRGPFRFLVETGAAVSAVAPELVEAANLNLDNGGTIDSVNIGSMRLDDLPVIILALDSAHGWLGLNSYRDLLLTLDYPNRRVRFERGTLPPANGRDILGLQSVEGQLWGFEIEVAGQRVMSVMDTQNEGVFNQPTAIADSTMFVRQPLLVGKASGPGIGEQEARMGRLRGDIKGSPAVLMTAAEAASLKGSPSWW